LYFSSLFSASGSQNPKCKCGKSFVTSSNRSNSFFMSMSVFLLSNWGIFGPPACFGRYSATGASGAGASGA
jgi:hypothetical protein